MEKLSFDIAIIGGGISAITFAENYKKFNPDKSVAIFEKSNEEPYSKVLLPHFVKKIIPIEKVIIRTQKQIEDKGIRYYKNEEILTINTKGKTFTSSSFIISYNQLVIATGGQARQIVSSNYAFYLQTLQDAKNLITKLETLEKNSSAVIVGGGFISFEFFEIFKKYNLKIINLLKSGLYFPNLAPIEITTVLKDILKQNSVDDVVSIEQIQDISESSITFDNKTIPASIVAIGAGITRTHSLFGKIEEGIKTNEFLKTEHKDIYAIGDIAIVTKNNIPRITGNWNNAIQQGIWLAKYLSNQAMSEYSFNRSTDYTTSFFGNHLSFIGNTNQSLVDNKIIKSEDNKFITECFINNNLVGAVILNSGELRSFYQEKINSTIC